MTPALVGRVRTGAAVAAVVLAVLSRGDTLVLAAALVLTAWQVPALGVVPALAAASWRWGSTSLEAMAGAQAVLGWAGGVGPASAAIGSWLAAAALVLAAPGAPRRASSPSPPALLLAAATGTVVAVVLAGPAPGGDLWQRVVVGLGAAGAALVVGRLRGDDARARVLDVAAAGGAAGAVIAVSFSAPGWSGTFDGAAALEGLAVATAALALVSVGAWGAAAMRNRQA